MISGEDGEIIGSGVDRRCEKDNVLVPNDSHDLFDEIAGERIK